MYDYDRKASAKRATLDNGPVGRALSTHWNDLHDIEYELKQTLREYGDAAHFSGGPAQRDAEEMIKMIERVAKEIDHLASHMFNILVDEEAKFVKKFGEPGKYADEMRVKTFPR